MFDSAGSGLSAVTSPVFRKTFIEIVPPLVAPSFLTATEVLKSLVATRVAFHFATPHKVTVTVHRHPHLLRIVTHPATHHVASVVPRRRLIATTSAHSERSVTDVFDAVVGRLFEVDEISLRRMSHADNFRRESVLTLVECHVHRVVVTLREEISDSVKVRQRVPTRL